MNSCTPWRRKASSVWSRWSTRRRCRRGVSRPRSKLTTPHPFTASERAYWHFVCIHSSFTVVATGSLASPACRNRSRTGRRIARDEPGARRWMVPFDRDWHAVLGWTGVVRPFAADVRVPKHELASLRSANAVPEFESAACSSADNAICSGSNSRKARERPHGQPPTPHFAVNGIIALAPPSKLRSIWFPSTQDTAPFRSADVRLIPRGRRHQ